MIKASVQTVHENLQIKFVKRETLRLIINLMG